MKSLAELLRHHAGAVIVCTPPWSRKHEWWARFADELLAQHIDFDLLSVDPGCPIAGPPGAVTLLERRRGKGFAVRRLGALCTLDAARFRLPLLLEAGRLRRVALPPLVFVDPPSIYRGVAASELLEGLIEQLSVNLLVAVDEPPLALGAGAIEIVRVDERVEKETGSERIARRTASWNEHLEGGARWVHSFLPLRGTPPPQSRPEAWPGRQVAILGERGDTLGLGECLRLDSDAMHFVAPRFDLDRARSFLVRDARRDEAGNLRTVHREASVRSVTSIADLHAGGGEVERSPRVTSLKTAKALLVNGVFGDPLLHIRLRHRRRSFLFDLGETARLPARIVHQVSDVFISHAHFDHIGGFLWFLRSCIGSPARRRVFGPPGLADHLEGMIAGIRWDRIGERGPSFEVGEVHGDHLERCLLRVGATTRVPLERRVLNGRRLLEEPELEVRAVELDHGIPVLAFAFVERRVLHVRKDRLEATRLPPGRWLGELKQAARHGQLDEKIRLPDGRVRPAADLSDELLLSSPGGKLIYATDLDDTEDNRRRLVEFSRGAELFYCEAAFLEKDAELARRTQHLTARAAGEIAKAAAVEQLVPFHFSKRYEDDAESLYEEIRTAFPERVVGLR